MSANSSLQPLIVDVYAQFWFGGAFKHVFRGAYACNTQFDASFIPVSQRLCDDLCDHLAPSDGPYNLFVVFSVHPAGWHQAGRYDYLNRPAVQLDPAQHSTQASQLQQQQQKWPHSSCPLQGQHANSSPAGTAAQVSRVLGGCAARLVRGQGSRQGRMQIEVQDADVLAQLRLLGRQGYRITLVEQARALTFHYHLEPNNSTDGSTEDPNCKKSDSPPACEANGNKEIIFPNSVPVHRACVASQIPKEAPCPRPKDCKTCPPPGRRVVPLHLRAYRFDEDGYNLTPVVHLPQGAGVELRTSPSHGCKIAFPSVTKKTPESVKAALDKLNGQTVTKYALTEDRYVLLLLGRTSACADEQTAAAFAKLIKQQLNAAGSSGAGVSASSTAATALVPAPAAVAAAAAAGPRRHVKKVVRSSAAAAAEEVRQEGTKGQAPLPAAQGASTVGAGSRAAAAGPTASAALGDGACSQEMPAATLLQRSQGPAARKLRATGGVAGIADRLSAAVTAVAAAATAAAGALDSTTSDDYRQIEAANCELRASAMHAGIAAVHIMREVVAMSEKAADRAFQMHLKL